MKRLHWLILVALLVASSNICNAQEPASRPASQPAGDQPDGKDGDKDGDQNGEDKPEDAEEEAKLPEELEKLKDLYAKEIATLDSEYNQDNPPPEKGGTFEQAEKILLKIAANGKKRYAYFLVQILKEKLKHPEIFLEAWQAQRKAIGTIKEDTKAWDFIIKKIERRNTDWKERVDLIYAMRDHEGEGANEALTRAMRDKDDHVAGAALRTLAYRKVAKAVPAIIKIFAKHEKNVDRKWLDARQSLTAITGYDFATAREWRAKWKEIGKDFDPETMRGRSKLFLPTDSIASDRVIMLLDTSSSMKYRDPLTGINRELDPRTTTAENPVERERLFRGKRRMQDLLLTLRKKAKFNICHFNQRAFSWQPGGYLIRVEDGSIDTALDYLENYKPKGLSNALAGFEKAFKDKEVDTIYYMSDGIASNRKGNRVPYLTLLAQVRNMNRHRAVRINSVSFKGADRGFMVKLAIQNGGSYQEIP